MPLAKISVEWTPKSARRWRRRGMGEALEASASAGGLAEPIVRLEGIWKSFSRIEVLTDVSLSVQKGEVVCIIGPSGAGKSTLLRCINYLEPIDDGTIYSEGQPAFRYKRHGRLVHEPDPPTEQVRSQIGMALRSPNLFP